MNPCNIVTFKCARCGEHRQESNGWFVAGRKSPGPLGAVYVWVRLMDHDEPPLADGANAICSRTCLLGFIEDAISGPDKNAPAGAAAAPSELAAAHA